MNDELVNRYFSFKNLLYRIEILYAKAVHAKNNEELEKTKNICEEISNELLSYNGPGSRNIKIEYLNAMEELLEMPVLFCTTKAQLNLHKKTILHIIDILENANKAFSEGDFPLCLNLIKTAENLIPGFKDKYEKVILDQIHILRSKLPKD